MNDKLKRGCLVGCGGAVVLIVAVIFIYPAMKAAKTNSHHDTCFANMKQLGSALQQYTDDYDGDLPPVESKRAVSTALADTASDGPAPSKSTWRTLLVTYLQSDKALECQDRDQPAAKGPDGFSTSYAVNTAGSAKTGTARGPFAPSAKPANVKKAATPANVIAIAEAQSTDSPSFDIDDPKFGPSPQILYAGHNGKSNYVFLDGHAAGLAPSDTTLKTNLWYLDGSALSPAGQATIKATEQAFGR